MSTGSHYKVITIRLNTTRVLLFFLAAMIATASAVLAHKSAHAREFKDSNAILRGLVPITGVEDVDKRAIDLDIRFAVNSSRLTETAWRQLDALGSALRSERLAAFQFEINGHTDASGNAAYNQELSERRAKTVKNYLIETHGIQPERLTAVGWGEGRPINQFDPSSAENRRVEIVNLAPLNNEASPTQRLPEKDIKDGNGDRGQQAIN